jgi:hypothetical protein
MQLIEGMRKQILWEARFDFAFMVQAGECGEMRLAAV